MKQLQLRPGNLDLLRRLDGDQDGRVDPGDVRAALAAGWLDGGNGLSGRQYRLLQRLLRRPEAALRVALGRRRLRGMRDWTWAARRLSHGMAATAGLPAVLLDLGSARVGHGDDPGNYYCEHVFFSLLQAATEPGSTVRRDLAGDPIVGFLHVPGDTHCRQPVQELDQAVRHAALRHVVAAALRGIGESLDTAAPLPVLITGFGPFRRIQNNPTGDFVTHGENLDAAMTLAFGQALAGPGTAIGAGTADHQTRRYLVTAADGTRREIRLHAVRLAVDDATLAPDGDASLQRILATIAPHAVLAMGVASQAPPGEYRVEHHADDGNLRQGRHVRGAGPTCSLPANYALARAIQLGAALMAADHA